MKFHIHVIRKRLSVTDVLARLGITRPLISWSSTTYCLKKNIQEISGGSSGDSKSEGHEGKCLGLTGIYSFPA